VYSTHLCALALPATLLSEELGCTARDSDGHSDTQWISI
jgi:hypothetical protein